MYYNILFTNIKKEVVESHVCLSPEGVYYEKGASHVLRMFALTFDANYENKFQSFRKDNLIMEMANLQMRWTQQTATNKLVTSFTSKTKSFWNDYWPVLRNQSCTATGIDHMLSYLQIQLNPKIQRDGHYPLMLCIWWPGIDKIKRSEGYTEQVRKVKNAFIREGRALINHKGTVIVEIGTDKWGFLIRRDYFV